MDQTVNLLSSDDQPTLVATATTFATAPQPIASYVEVTPVVATEASGS